MAKNNEIEYGNVSIPDEAFEDKNIRVNISLRVRGDILKAFREEAEKEGMGYQTLMHQALTQFIRRPSMDSRLAKLEQAVFKKAN